MTAPTTPRPRSTARSPFAEDADVQPKSSEDYLALQERLPLLRAYMDDETLLAPPRAVLPYLAYAGRVTLLSAREKLGKTTLVAQGASQLSHGREFLGEQTVASKVLWYAIDEPLGDTVRRFQRLGANPDRITVATHRPTATELRDDCEFAKPSLVVIDTFSELQAMFVDNDREAGAMTRFLRPYVAAMQDFGDAALVLIYHTNRGGREYKGSVALGATVDAPLTLRRHNLATPAAENIDVDDEDDDVEHDPRRVLVGMTRWGRVRLRLRFDEATGLYGLSTTGSRSLEDRIHAELVQADKPLSANAVAARVGGQKKRCLDTLKAENGKGRWYRNRDGEWEAGSRGNPLL